MNPLLLLDVDGVISLFGFDPHDRPAGEFRSIDGNIHYLSATAGALIRGLAGTFELAWCTGWEERANEHLPAFLGLPGPLPVLSFDRNPGRANAHWKLAAIDAFAGPDRPLAWVDDALNDDCERWAAARSARTRLVHTHPATGLLRAHADELATWSDGLHAADRLQQSEREAEQGKRDQPARNRP